MSSHSDYIRSYETALLMGFSQEAAKLIAASLHKLQTIRVIER